MKRTLWSLQAALFTILPALLIAACDDGHDSPVRPDPGYEGFKVYMNNLTPEQLGSIVGEGRYVGGWPDVQPAFLEDDWTFVGEATSTRSFSVPDSFSHIMVLWERVGVKFDSFENLSTGASIAYNGNGEYVGEFYTGSNLAFDDEHAISGPPDGKYATSKSGGSIIGGFLLFTIPGNVNGTAEKPEEFRVTFEDYR